MQTWQILNRIADESDDEEDFPAVLEVAETTDAVSLPDLKTCCMTNAMSLCRTSSEELVSGASVLLTEHVGLVVAGPIPLSSIIWGAEEGIDGRFV